MDGEQPRPHLTLVRSPLTYERVVKPTIDFLLGFVFLILAIPVILLSASAVLIVIGRPVFFRQTRVGRRGETFVLYKLRTMLPDRRVAEVPHNGPERRQTHKSKEDPRVLPLGAALRALRLDELPQLLNVIKGDMSLVGPRPELPEIVAEYADWQHQRHDVKPGLTGLWQISSRNGEPMHECTDVDLEYVSAVSLRTDLSILARTPLAMVRRSGY